MYFHYIALISPWNRVWPNIWLYLNLLQLRMLCAKFCWNWVSGCGEDENVYSRQTSRQMDSRQKAIREAHLGFQLWCAKKKKKRIKWIVEVSTHPKAWCWQHFQQVGGVRRLCMLQLLHHLIGSFKGVCGLWFGGWGLGCDTDHLPVDAHGLLELWVLKQAGQERQFIPLLGCIQFTL